VQQTTSNIPEWARPYGEKILGQGAALTDPNQNPYQAYQGQRVAGFNPLQQQAFGSIQGMQTSPQTGQATGMAGMAGLGGLYAGQNYMDSATDASQISKLMSPYQQNVTDFQKRQAISDYGRQLPGMNAQAIGQGAFGGSRQAVASAENQRNLQNSLAGIQASGTQDAYRNAQQAQQFGANLGLQGNQLANTAAGTMLNAGQQDYNQQMGISSAQLQAGAQQQGLEQQNLTNKYADFQNQQRYPYQQLGFMSDLLRGMPSSQATQTMYTAPSNNIGQVAGLGLAGYNAFKKEGGIINGYKHGGAVHNFAEGGLASLTDPATEIAAKSKLPPTTSAIALAKFMLPVIEKMHQPVAQASQDTVALEMAREILSRNQMPQDMPQQMPPQDMPQQMPPQEMSQGEQPTGIANLPVDNFKEENYRGGGIVAFATGDPVRANVPSNEQGEGDATPVLPNEFPTREPVPQKPDTSAEGMYLRNLQNQIETKKQYKNRTLEDIISAVTAQRDKLGLGEVGSERQKELEKAKSEEGTRKDEAQRNFFISAGLNMAAEASKRGNPQSGIGALLQPLSVGAQAALPGYVAEQEKLRGLVETRNAEMAKIQDSRRADKAGIITLSQGIKDKEDARIEKMDEKILTAEMELAKARLTKEAAAAGRHPTDMVTSAQTHLESRIKAGDKRDPSTILEEGMNKYVELNRAYPPSYAATAQRAGASAESTEATNTKTEENARTAATKSTDAHLKSGMGALGLMKAQSLDKKNAATNAANKNSALPTNNEKTYKQNIWYTNYQNNLPDNLRTPAAPSAAPAAPATNPKFPGYSIVPATQGG
jgi:hypothetical protein